MTKVLATYLNTMKESKAFDIKGGKDARRLIIWENHLKGMSAAKISQYMGIPTAVVNADIRKSYDIARPEIVQSTVEHLAKYIAQQELIIHTGFELLERINAIEEMWVEKVFGDVQEENNECKQNLDEAPEEEYYAKTRNKRMPIDYGRVQIKNDRASILAEIGKASTAIAKAKGLLTEKIAISIDMMNDDDLLREAEKYGFDLAAMGIKLPAVGGQDKVRLLNPGYDTVLQHIDKDYAVIEGEKM